MTESHKVYLNFWVTHFGGCDRVQINVNISIFGWDCPSPPYSECLRVFPPFHWVFLEGKREKERKKKGIVKILAHFNVPLHGL